MPKNWLKLVFSVRLIMSYYKLVRDLCRKSEATSSRTLPIICVDCFEGLRWFDPADQSSRNVILALASNCCGLDNIEEELLEDVMEEEDPVGVDESFFQRANRFLPYPNPFPWRRWAPLQFRIVLNYGYNNAGLFRQFDTALENPFGNQLGLMTPQLPVESDEAEDLILNSNLLQNFAGELRQLAPAAAGSSCRSPTTREMGICTASAACTAGGGRVSGSCSGTLACCIRKFPLCLGNTARYPQVLHPQNS